MTTTPILASANEGVRRHLAMITAVRRLSAPLHPRPYLCIEEFVGKHGQAFAERVSRPARMYTGVPRCCFQNAAVVAVNWPDQYLYVEGFAVGMMPVHHAWCMDREGRVLDITWPEPGTPEMAFYETDYPPAYFGVVFAPSYVARTVLGGIGSCLDNYQERFPLLSGAHSLDMALHRPESEAA